MYPRYAVGNDRPVGTPGIIVAGGAAERLGGTDKADVRVGGRTLRDLATDRLAAICDPVVIVDRTMATGGPLVAVVAGWAAVLGAEPEAAGAMVLAVDMPFVPPPFLAWLAGHDRTVVPVVDGRAQPLCAHYHAGLLVTASRLVDRGERSMQALLSAGTVHRAGPGEWGPYARAADFADIDTPGDLAAARRRACSGS